MSEEELTEEQQKEEEDKAKAWLYGQKIAKRTFDNKAFETNQNEYQAEEDAEKMTGMVEGANQALKEVNKIEKSQIRRTKDEQKRTK